MSEHGQMDRIREESDRRKTSVQIGGVREWFDIDFLIGYIEGQERAIGNLQQEIEELQEFQNSIAARIPERYEDDVAQEAIIERWLDEGAPTTDAYDAANGVHRVSLDEGTVERAARVMHPEPWQDSWIEFNPDGCRRAREEARAKAYRVLAAAVKEDGE